MAEFNSKHKFRQKSLAMVVGISRTHISQIINRNVRPSYQVAKSLENETGVSVETWMNGTEYDIRLGLLEYSKRIGG